MSQHSGSQRPHLQIVLQPVQEKISKKKFIEQKLKNQKNEHAPPTTATKGREHQQPFTDAKFQTPNFSLPEASNYTATKTAK